MAKQDLYFETIGQWISWFRANRGWTLEQLGIYLGTTRMYAHRLESDKYLLPLKPLEKIAGVCTLEEKKVLRATIQNILDNKLGLK